jgi:hypothetical protein
MDFSNRVFANADFSECDAGAGDQDSLDILHTYVNLKTAISNLVDSASNIIDGDMDEYHKKLQIQKRNLQLLCSAVKIDFLEEILKPDNEEDNIKSMIDIASVLSDPKYNSFSKDYLHNLILDISGADAVDASELGVDFETANNIISKINELYITSVSDLEICDSTLHDDLERVKNLLNKVNTILNLEPNEFSSELYASLSKYIYSSLGNIKLVETFNNFIKARKKFIHYRNLLGLKNAATVPEMPPTCPICMENSVGTAIVGCGHTFCNTCAAKQIVHCYICRCKIQSKMRLFFN